MSRRNGCPRGVRGRAMWFALWAQRQQRCPTAAEVAALLGLRLNSARKWRNDWLLIRGLPPPAENLEGTS